MPNDESVLKNWTTLNQALRTADEDYCDILMRQETMGKARKQFLFRIHSRLNKVRADQERERIRGILKKKKENAR